MDASVLTGSLLSAACNVLLERLTPPRHHLLSLLFGKKLDNSLINRLNSHLIYANLLLDAAESRRFTDRNVKTWYDELMDAVYNLDDLTGDASQNQVCNPFLDSSPFDKIKDEIDRIESLVSRSDVLGLTMRSETENLPWKSQKTPGATAPDVCGRNREKEDLLRLLLADDGDELSVIPIVGMGGVGKTTLVRLVYHENDVKQKFHFMAWASVSENCDLLKLVRTILNQIRPDQPVSNNVDDLNFLQRRLNRNLKGKKFLIVLDNVWSSIYGFWDDLKELLDYKVKGCKFLVTTRDEDVASRVQRDKSLIYHLDRMSDEDCFSIFTRRAFQCRDSSMNSSSEKLARDVASKCGGLPLAASVLGGLFRPDNIERWNAMLKNNTLWKLDTDERIIPALRVSYFCLPPHLKQCFAYCSLFPKGYPFCKEHLILMWKAEGFLQLKENSNVNPEEVGDECFRSLTSISFLQPSHENDKYFVMHDLIHELATHVAGGLCSRLEKDGDRTGSKARHWSCNYLYYKLLDAEFFKNGSALRTFIGLRLLSLPSSIQNAPHVPLFKLKYLRTLSLSGLSSLKIVPDSIGECAQLRYLDLSYTKIVTLPDSLGKLYNLQTLILHQCHNLKTLLGNMGDLVNLCYLDLSSTAIEGLPDLLCELHKLQTLKVCHCYLLKVLPFDMQDFKNLQHLDTSGTPLIQMPRGLTKSTHLRGLSDFIVGTEHEAMIGGLGEISNWEVEAIKISNLERIKDVNEASKARMMEKKKIKDLKLSWSCDGFNVNVQIQTEKGILEKLQPHLGLRALEIHGYRGTEFPDWLGHDSYHNMTSLKLLGCKSCIRLPPLGQLPALKSLYIEELKIIEIGDEFLKGNARASMTPFASLEFLEFKSMGNWKKWRSSDDTQAFPKLKHLQLIDCDELDGNLPRQLLSLEILEIYRCRKFDSRIPRCPKLKNLEISESQKAVWQELDQFPPSLEKLVISGAQMLGSMAGALSQNTHIEDLSINDCSNMSLQTIELSLPKSLKHLLIEQCENINFVLCSTSPLEDLQLISILKCKSLEFSSSGGGGDIEGLVPNLKELRIKSYDEMEAFPQGILVSSLTSLDIRFSEKLVSCYAQWQQLPTRITCLQIRGVRGITDFPEAVSSLPSTLTTLELHGFENLEKLKCEILLQHLTSLQVLKIMFCEKLKNMTGKLPSSVRKLYIWECPLLEQRLNKDEEIMAIVAGIQIISVSPLNPDHLQ